MKSYLTIFFFLIIAIVFATVALAVGFLLSKSKPEKAKALPYECGFDSIGDARKPFYIRYYLIAILFLLFDVETVFFFPWAVSLRNIGWFGFGSMMLFLCFLFIAFLYEWRAGVFEWD